jgi:PleD family two-component response regulator
MSIHKGIVLLVDDSQTIRAVIGQHLRVAGYEPLFAADGHQALETLEHAPVDAVLLDINLPDIDGYTVCRGIKANPRTYHIPVIVLTSMSDTEAELAAIDAGADDYIPKPPQPRVLDARLHMHIKRAVRERCSNPLTGLPGNVIIEQALTERFASGAPLCLAYIDLDDFKSYNDRFGYLRGDSVILLAASILIGAVEAEGRADDFVGHIGGDDFVVMTAPERINAIADHITRAFDEAVPAFYDDETRDIGWFEATDRRGHDYRVPIMSVSIASVNRSDRPFETSLEMVDAVTELKHHAKSIPGSVHIRERRHDAVGSPRQQARAAEG